MPIKKFKALVRSGRFKSEKQIADEMARKTQKIMQSHNILRQEIGSLPSISNGGYSFRGNVIGTHYPTSIFGRLVSPVHSVFDKKKTTDLIHEIAMRHEVDEVLAYKKFKNIAKKYYLGSKDSDALIMGKYNPFLVPEGVVTKPVLGKKITAFLRKHNVNAPYSISAAHTNLGVLAKEHNNLLDMGRHPAAERIKKLRKIHGESAMIDNLLGKKMDGQVFTPEDINDLILAGRKNIAKEFANVPKYFPYKSRYELLAGQNKSFNEFKKDVGLYLKGQLNNAHVTDGVIKYKWN